MHAATLCDFQSQHAVQGLHALPAPLAHSVLAAAVRHVLPPFMSLVPCVRAFQRPLLPSASTAVMLLQALPHELRHMIVSACCIAPQGTSNPAQTRTHCSSSQIGAVSSAEHTDADNLQGTAPVSSSSSTSRNGQELYLPMAGLTQEGAAAFTRALEATSHCQRLTSASMPACEGGASAPLRGAARLTSASDDGPVAAALPILAQLTCLTRLVLQGAASPLPMSQGDLMRADHESRIGMQGAHNSDLDDRFAGEHMKLPSLLHLELRGCGSSVTADLVQAAPTQLRLLAIVERLSTDAGKRVLQHVGQMAGLRVLSFSRSSAADIAGMQACSLPAVLSKLQKLQYVGLAHCNSDEAVASDIASALQGLPELRCLHATAFRMNESWLQVAYPSDGPVLGSCCHSLQVRAVTVPSWCVQSCLL